MPAARYDTVVARQGGRPHAVCAPFSRPDSVPGRSVAHQHCTVASLGWAGFQLRGGRGSCTALWLDPPKKRPS